MIDGILVINKPGRWTSQDVCARLRHRLHVKKIGHTGTLDPMATGVLPVCIGKATRIIEYFDLDRKSYHAGMQLGLVSDTLDIWGEVSRSCNVVISEDQNDPACEYAQQNCSDNEHSIETRTISTQDILHAFSDYTGKISQIPPKYSALKINGKRAYDLARQGADFEIKPREITIFSNEITAIDAERGIIEFDVTCSKGTYIRTICDDIGRELGCGAVMSSLVRKGSGVFRLEDALTIDQINEMTDDEIESHLISMDVALANLGKIELYDNRVTAYRNGNSSRTGFRVTEESNFQKIREPGRQDVPVYRIYNRGVFLGTGLIVNTELIPDKVIH